MSYKNSFKLKIVKSDIDPLEIIAKLRESSEDADALIDENGSTNESFSGYKMEEDVRKFSERYPDAVFQLDVDWDSGFGDPPSRWLFCNGKKKDIKVKIVYDDFDPNNF